MSTPRSTSASSPPQIPRSLTLAGPSSSASGMRDAAEDDSDSPPSQMSEDDPGGVAGDRWEPDLRGGGSSNGRWAPPDQVLENVLESVLEFLTAARDRNAASLVCRSWYRAEAQTRRDLFIGNCYAVSPRRAVERFGRVRAVVLKGKPRFADFSLVPFGWGAYASPWLAALGPAYPRLERICLKRMTVTDDDLTLVAKSFPLFKELSLVCCDGFSTLGLAVLAEGCRYVTVVLLYSTFESGLVSSTRRTRAASKWASGIVGSILPALLALGGVSHYAIRAFVPIVAAPRKFCLIYCARIGLHAFQFYYWSGCAMDRNLISASFYLWP
jgi:hypothetical protein